MTTAYELAERFIGLREVNGHADNPAILAMLRLDASFPRHDEVPWCSAFVNYVAWLLRLPRSKSLAARSWLRVGRVISLDEAEPENDVIILRRGASDAGPEVRNAPGHVGFFSGLEGDVIHVLGGNQGNSVSVAPYNSARLLGARRLISCS